MHCVWLAAASRTPQKFTPYGALYGAPLQDDGIPNTRKDFTYAEATTGACLRAVPTPPVSPGLIAIIEPEKSRFLKSVGI